MEGLAGVGERVDAFVEPVKACSEDVQQLGTGLEVGARAGRAGQQEPDVFGRESRLEQPPDLGHGQDGVVGVLAVAVGAAAGLEQTLGFVVAQQMRATPVRRLSSPINTFAPP